MFCNHINSGVHQDGGPSGYIRARSVRSEDVRQGADKVQELRPDHFGAARSQPGTHGAETGTRAVHVQVCVVLFIEKELLN